MDKSREGKNDPKATRNPVRKSRVTRAHSNEFDGKGNKNNRQHDGENADESSGRMMDKITGLPRDAKPLA